MHYYLEQNKISVSGHGILSDCESMMTLLRNANIEVYNRIVLHLKVDMTESFLGWFRSHFASVFLENGIQSLEGIWDIVVGGSPGILCYVGATLLIAAKRKIFTLDTLHEFEEMCENIHNHVDLYTVYRNAVVWWEKIEREKEPL